MNTNLLTFLFLALPLLCHHVTADDDKTYNITQILGKDPTFSSFNDYLTKAELPAMINSRVGITVLVVNNRGMDLLKDKPKDVVRKIMGMHVLLNYFSPASLQAISGDPVHIPTLFKQRGQAFMDQGILTIHTHDAQTTFTTGPSAGSGTHVKAYLTGKVIYDREYVISVLEISSLIIAPGIENPPALAIPLQLNVPSSPQATGIPAPPNAAPSQPPSVSAPPQANAPGSPQSAGAPTPSHANAPGSPQSVGAPTPSHANAPGSPQTAKAAPTPSHANAPGPTGSDESPSPSRDAETPASAPEATSASDAPENSPDESYGVRIASSINPNAVLATSLFVLAFLGLV